MPNPTSKLNLVINGTTTQLDIHDANAVDLTSNQTVGGNKEFTGTTTAHDVIPSATDTYNFGSSTAQWNNAYIKSLTINGVACGDILTYNASEFVSVTGAQTISGIKTFVNALTVTRPNIGTTGYVIKLTFKRGDAIASVNHSTFRITDSEDIIVSEVCTENYVDGKVAQILNVRNTTNNGTQVQSSISHLLDKTGEQDWFYSVRNGKTYLGTPAYKWADVNTNLINGINPGALSLPSISANGANAWIALDTTDWVKSVATSTAQKYTPPADGWLNIRVNNATMLSLAITGGGNYMHQMVRSETPNSLALLIPVFKNTEVAIMVAGNENLVYGRSTFYPCQGNV